MRGLIAVVLAFGIALGLQPVSAGPRWEPAIPGVPPGGFAKVTVEGVQHGNRRVPADFLLRIRADKERTTILVKLDGRYVTQSGQPFKSVTDNPADLPHWSFVETRLFEVPISGLAPGVHHVEIRRGIKGSSLPIVNEQGIWFSVGE